MVAGVRPDYPSDWPAICAVAEKLGIGTAETLRKWVRKAEVDAGTRPGLTSEEHAEIRRLKRENAELRRANEILKAASVFFRVYVTIHRSGRLRCDDPLAWRVGSFLRCPVVTVAVPRCAARQARAAPVGVT
jgi:transposase